MEENLTSETLLEELFSPVNLNRAYQQELRNAGAGGIDNTEVDKLLPHLTLHKEEQLASLFNGRYTPTPVRRVDIPKGTGKTRSLGIPTVVDRLIQQAKSKVLTRIKEKTKVGYIRGMNFLDYSF